VPKLGYDALRRACAPVIVVADRLPATVRPGDPLAVDVHVVSDLRLALEGLTCTATMRWGTEGGPGGRREWRFEGDVGPDAVVRIGTLSLDVPAAPGSLTLDLAVTGPGLPGPVHDTDRTEIVRA
jgi:beta-mannosidase